jgi:Ca2+-binding RTX toxin-like protein
MALLQGSPAINKGKSSLVPAGVTTDQRGVARVGKVDIGAYEFPAAVISGNLIVRGTPYDDDITVAKGTTASKAIVTINGTELGTFGGVLKTDVRAGAGDDDVSLTNGFARPATLVGGDGRDTLTGGQGRNVLLGGGDLDVLTGGAGRDLIVGGTEADNLSGGSGDDILIGGTLSYYNESTESVNAAKIGLVMKEWGSASTYPQRIAHLKNGGGLNGPARIKNSTVLQDGGAVDNLAGDLGRDWFVVSSEDLLTDQAANETKTVV